MRLRWSEGTAHSRVQLAGAVLLAFALLLALVAAVWFVSPYLAPDPLPLVKARTGVKVWTDRAGRELHYERTYNHEWRFDIPLSEIPGDVVEFMLATEDARFRSHRGVDYLALARAVLQNLASGRILSGASTISMQLAGMDYSPRRRTLLRKFMQAAKARRMEMLHSKNEILEAYFNNLPYGGQLYGIEAAARYYFGMHASELTVVEASVLCGIPQRPNRYRPDRNPEAVRDRQRRVLKGLVRAGKLLAEEARRIYFSERLRYRDFREPAPFERLARAGDWIFVKDTLGTIDSELTVKVKRILGERLRGMGDVRDAAAVLMDVATGEIRAYVGTLDFNRPDDGQYDAARGMRSAGSTLKPFIYLEALKGGIIDPESRLLDAPVRWGGYAPGNYDGSYRGVVSATEALSHSLNTPVIRLLSELGEKRVTAAFDRLGLACTEQVRTNGLALALGSAGYRLVDLTRAYRGLVASTGDCERAVVEMLWSRPLPGTEHEVAWKTGTSNNNRDAWCFGMTPEWTVGVWYGNKSGARSKHLVGAELAAPAVAEIFELLYGGRQPAPWPQAKVRLRAAARKAVCSASGRTVILSPGPGDYALKPGEDKVTFALAAEPEKVCWFADGVVLGSSPAVRQAAFASGRHELVAVPEDPARMPATVVFSVK